MIKAIKVTNYRGESLTMTLADPWSSGLNITNIDGIGAPETDVSISDLATTDGGLFTNAKAKSRTITIDLKPMKKNNIEQARHLVYRYFPIKQLCELEFITTERDIMISGYVQTITPTIFSDDESISIEIVCPDPYFYTVSGPIDYVFSGTDPLFEFPFSNELENVRTKTYHKLRLEAPKSTLECGKPYYIPLPGTLGEMQFMLDGSSVYFNSGYACWLYLYAYDGVADNGTMEIYLDNGELIGTVQLTPRTDADTRVFSYDAQTGIERWSAVTPTPVTLEVDPILDRTKDFKVTVPDRGTYYFTLGSDDAPQTITSWELSLNKRAGVIEPYHFSINDLILDAHEGNSGSTIFPDETCPVHLMDYEYEPVEITITELEVREMDDYTHENHLVLSEIKAEAEATLDYEGDAETGMLITIQAKGAVSSFMIYDLHNDTYLSIDTSKISGGFTAGDQILVNTYSGNKYVRLLRGGQYTNIINALDRGSTFFRLLPGPNTYAYSAANGVEHLNFKMSYKTAYQGV